MTTKRVPFEIFKSIVAAGETMPDDTIVVRSGPSIMQPVGGERRLLWCISTSAVDRMGDVIEVDGWDLRNYEAGGSVLWAHDPTVLPVAKPVKTYTQGGKLWSVAEYPHRDVSEFADTVYKLALGGYLRGASIGMRPIEYMIDEGRRSAEFQFPMRFKRQELLEWSHTPIPANPEALLSAKSYGIDIAPLKAWSMQVLDEGAQLFGMSRSDIERAYAIAGNESTNITVPDVVREMPMDPAAAGSDGAPVDTSEAAQYAECNDMLSNVLAMADKMREAKMAEMLDVEGVRKLLELFNELTAESGDAEDVEDVVTEQNPEPMRAAEDVVIDVSEPSTKSAPHGVEALASKSHEDLTSDDIRGIVREVMSSTGLSRKRCK